MGIINNLIASINTLPQAAPAELEQPSLLNQVQTPRTDTPEVKTFNAFAFQTFVGILQDRESLVNPKKTNQQSSAEALSDIAQKAVSAQNSTQAAQAYASTQLLETITSQPISDVLTLPIMA